MVAIGLNTRIVTGKVFFGITFVATRTAGGSLFQSLRSFNWLKPDKNSARLKGLTLRVQFVDKIRLPDVRR